MHPKFICVDPRLSAAGPGLSTGGANPMKAKRSRKPKIRRKLNKNEENVAGEGGEHPNFYYVDPPLTIHQHNFHLNNIIFRVDFAWTTDSTFVTTRSCANMTTKSGWCLRVCPTIITRYPRSNDRLSR